MSLTLDVRKFHLWLLVFGVFVPRALAGFGVCKPGWEWVSGAADFSMLTLFESPRGDKTDTRSFPG